MNERIIELAEQCGFRSNPNIYDRNQSFDIEKFAELIVRECIAICESGTPTQTTSGGAAELIKQHFGVVTKQQNS